MFRPLSLFIGLRYSRAKRRNHFISFISGVSIIGLTLSVTALITVMSVMNGFDYQLRARILGAVSQATISGVGSSIQDWPHALKIAKADPRVKGAAPYVEQQALVQGAGSSGAIVRGIVPSLEPQVSDFNKHMRDGSLDTLQPGKWNIVIGDELAMMLGVTVGDKVIVFAPRYRGGPMGAMPTLRAFRVSGIFALGMQQYDSGLALMNMQDAEKLYGLSGPTGIRLHLDNLFHAGAVARHLSDEFGGVYRVETWMQTNANLFKAIAMEKKVMFLILSLIVLVAVINLVSMLVMLVTDKQSDIAILRTLGITPRTVMGVFMVQGLFVGVMGILVGVVCGVTLSLNLPAIAEWIEHTFHVQFLAPDVYYISELPSRLQWSDVGWVAGIAFVLSLLATLYPAWRASRTQPAQALRYE
ncbi:lipoprotein-releasing ABC transporter permease subunit [Oleiagrimonas soli]|uniref:Cell division protein FtsX n=1 Tax=Oleiagrimonas soli TaxID=1543381 RepID=A0A099CWX4_9GAMM|nr:lipoprotein-releasing ABC transporter permease subunit [Oleiagrimonas soli]KGI78137.1 cell division protein FtsX [Oleiagrimonas soli]MBB6183416.1 lipoprotein-releasing system permease protein [Oleiagrimonas soli]